MRQRAAHALVPVDRNADADAGAADGDTERRLPRIDRLRQFKTEIGVIDAVLVIRAKVDNVMPRFFEVFDNGGLQLKARMVGRNGYFFTLGQGFDPKILLRLP